MQSAGIKDARGVGSVQTLQRVLRQKQRIRRGGDGALAFGAAVVGAAEKRSIPINTVNGVVGVVVGVGVGVAGPSPTTPKRGPTILPNRGRLLQTPSKQAGGYFFTDTPTGIGWDLSPATV